MIAMFLTCACSADPITAPDAEGRWGPNFPPAVGLHEYPVEEFGFHPSLQWGGADQRTIYYLPRGGSARLSAYSIASGATHQLVSDGRVSYQVLHASVRGEHEHLFYSTVANSEYTINRIASDGRNPESLIAFFTGPIFAISEDGGTLAWRGADSIFVRELTSGATRSLQSLGYPMSISPDGTRLVHGLPFTSHVRVSTLAGGATDEVLPIGGPIEDVRWNGSVPELLRVEASGIQVVRPGAAPVWLYQRPFETAYRIVGVKWSPDGTTVAASMEGNCLSEPCGGWLTLIDVATGEWKRVAGGNVSYVSRPAYSADGTIVAIVVDGRLHLVPVPSFP